MPFSARVPRSSSELHRDFSDHILEDEVDRQEEEQGDQRDRDEEREEKGVGEINERNTHNEMTHVHDNEISGDPEPCRRLSQCSVQSSEQGKQSRDADTNNKEERH